MSELNLLIDSYERKARLYPSLILIAPIILAYFAFFSQTITAMNTFLTLIISCGGAYFLSQMARDSGKKGEAILFKKWDGIPAVAIFRHRDIRLNSKLKERYHKKLSILVENSKAPTSDEEIADPLSADNIYLAWSTYLRTKTRDIKKYTLLFKENTNYGYRRNVWGFRRLGIIISGGCFLIVLSKILQLYYAEKNIDQHIIAYISSIFVFHVLWLIKFNDEWVKVPADAYAARLIESIEDLAEK